MTITVTPIRKRWELDLRGSDTDPTFCATSHFRAEWLEGEERGRLWATVALSHNVGRFTADEVEQIAEQLYQFAKHMRGEA